MNMKKEAKRIYKSSVSIDEKKRLLNELVNDCLNEMDADDQNMQSDIDHELASGYVTAKKYLSQLEL